MARLVHTEISDILIIKACNTETGTGGVARWLSGVQNRVLARCIETAPVNDFVDRMHRPWDPGGTYRDSFVALGKVGNGHVIQRAVSNTAPHAIFVERGRSGSSKWQFYSSKRWPEPHWSEQTGPRAGRNIMENALEDVLRTSKAYHAHAVPIRS